MRIVFRKLSDETHTLDIVRRDGHHETVECETRSYLTHDLLHYAVEVAGHVESGFWGRLAAGATLAEMNDRTTAMGDDMASVEQVVGALSGALKTRSPDEVIMGMKRFAASLGTTLPGWLTEAFVVAVEEHMRQLLGRWKATPFGEGLELEWVG